MITGTETLWVEVEREMTTIMVLGIKIVCLTVMTIDRNISDS